MDCNGVLFDLRTGQSTGEKPLMLHSLLFCPVLTWVCQELSNRGVERFFIACDDAWQADAQQAAAPFSGVTILSGDVKTMPQNVTVIARAVLPIPSEEGECGFLPFAGADILRAAVPAWREIQMARLASRGVNVIDPTNTYVDPCCTVARGVTLLPGTILRGKTTIGAGCQIGPNTMIRDSRIGEHTTVNASQVNESVIGSHTTVGPFAYVRPGCTVGDGCRVGDFVELKNSVLGNGTKVSHLTYVGDSDVGQRVNFGCGTVTTNYDGKHKYRCTIGDDVFIGCNTNLVAPVTLGNGSYTAAGSTITEDVPEDALALARSRQSNKLGWAARWRGKTDR
ncbi:MAG: glucosamine-1-phosphate N-acetyltransferase [Oscillospiraceae bacterium]|nr:glucosamine-1-phosphate N-acetyltransferase [Oscillospiraceae bacterium]